MSYQQRVLRDNPIGFWALDSVSPEVDSSTGVFIAGTRTLNNATLGTNIVTGRNPLVCGGDASIQLESVSDCTVTIDNNYNVFYAGTERKSFSIEFWMSIENQSSINNTSILKINNVMNLSLIDNILKLEIIDSKASTSKYGYLELESLDPQIYVNISYSDRTFSLTTNGNDSINIQMDPIFKFKSSNPENFIFTANELGSSKILIDSIAFYNYRLTSEQIQNHLVWGLSDKSANAWVLENNGGYISPKDENGKAENYYIFAKDTDWKNGSFKNCFSDNGVLTARYIPPMTKYNESSELVVSLDETNGLQVALDSSLMWDNFNSYFTPLTDSLQVTVKASSQCSIMSMSGFGFGQLVLRYNSSGKIELYCPETPSISLESSAVATNTWKDVLIYFTENKINMKVGTSSVITYDLGNAITSDKLRLYLGNSYIVDSLGATQTNPLVGGLKNLYIYKNDNTKAGLGNGYIRAELLNDYKISQYSEWSAQILPKSSRDIIGSRIDIGTASNNISVFTSLDNSTWTQVSINKGEIESLTLNDIQPIFYVKIEINTPDSSINRPNVNYLEVITYSSLYMDSRGNHFSLTPAVNSKHSYTVRPNEYNVLSRDRNIGISFQNGGGVDASHALITPSNDYEAIEFWFKVHEDPSAIGSYYILDKAGIVGGGLHYDESLELHNNGLIWHKVYINGVEKTGTVTLKVDEIYHFVGIMSTTYSDNMTLNSRHTGDDPGLTSIGNICLYSSSPFSSSAVVLQHYKRYLGINNYPVSDSTSITISDSANVFAAQWAIIKSAMV